MSREAYHTLPSVTSRERSPTRGSRYKRLQPEVPSLPTVDKSPSRDFVKQGNSAGNFSFLQSYLPPRYNEISLKINCN